MAVTWNPADVTHVTLSGGNLLATYDASNARGGVRASISKSAGKWYYELQYAFSGASNEGGGWASASKNFATTFLGGDTLSAGAYRDGSVYFNGGSLTSWIATPATSDWVAICLDLDNNKIWVKNLTQAGGWNNGSIGTQDPGNNIGGGSVSTLTGTPWLPAVAFDAIGTGTYSFLANFGATAFQGAVPTNFTQLDSGAGPAADVLGMSQGFLFHPGAGPTFELRGRSAFPDPVVIPPPLPGQIGVPLGYLFRPGSGPGNGIVSARNQAFPDSPPGGGGGGAFQGKEFFSPVGQLM